MKSYLLNPVGWMIRLQAELRGSKTAFRDARSALTFKQLRSATGGMAGYLQQTLAPGDLVAIWLPSSVEWVVSCLGILRAGLVVVPIPHEASLEDVYARLQDSGAKAIICQGSCAGRLASICDGVANLAVVDLVDRSFIPYDSVVDSYWGRPRDPEDLDRAAFLLHDPCGSSESKAVLLSTRSMVWVTAVCWVQIFNLSESDNVVCPLPIYRPFALSLCLLGVLVTGATVRVMERYSCPDLLSLLDSGAYTMLPGAAGVFGDLLEARKEGQRVSIPEGMRCISDRLLTAHLKIDFERQLGVRLFEAYGTPETSTVMAVNGPRDRHPEGACGLPLPGLALRIVEPMTQLDVEPGTVGELIVRGPNVMLGYHNRPIENQRVFRDGWLRTGESARFDCDGLLFSTQQQVG